MDVIKNIDAEALLRLKAYRDRLTIQEYKTLRGQVLAGNAEAAVRGLQKILRRKKAEQNTIIMPDGSVHRVKRGTT